MNTKFFSIVRVLLAGVLVGAGVVPVGGTATVPVSATVISPPPPDADIVDDFNDGNDLNYWDGAMGALEEVSGDGSIAQSYETAGAFAGRSLKLSYDLTKASSWNGYFLNLNTDSAITKNISAYNQLSFWVKGAVGGVEHLKIGLENTSLESTNRSRVALYVNDYLNGGITNQWQKVSIPLTAYSGLNSFVTAKTLTFVFERSYADPALHPNLAQAATVFIDDVRFSSAVLPEVRVDYFNDAWGLNSLGANWGDMKGIGRAIEFVAGEATAYTMVSKYNVNVEAWQGHFCLFGGGNSGWGEYPVNLSNYRYLKFRARARSAGENPVSFKVEVNSTSIYVDNLTTTDKTFTLDLNASVPNRSAISKISIVYEKARVTSKGGSKAGVVYFDDIRFTVNP
jgi:hypothetical protein